MAASVEANAGAAVIVPTRDRPKSLARCLDALDRQERVPGLDVVVVDDGSLDAAAVAEAVARSERARLVRWETPRGPAAARNRGARETEAAVLLFTDDDCEPEPAWAAGLAGALEEGAQVVAGVTTNGSPGDPLASASETILEYVQDRARSNGSSTLFAATNNVGCTAHVLAEVPFDESYRYGEDRDWCARLLAAGYTLTVESSAAVVHCQELRLSSFLEQQFGYGRGAYRFRRRSSSFPRLEPPSFYAGLLRRGFSRGIGSGMLVGVAQAATAAGFMREALSRHAR
jgi:glycosyltransferase involved in cell wall biosynthesis